MLRFLAGAVAASLLASAASAADEMEHHHDHPAPERLGSVRFATSCSPKVQARFDRAVALLHSFTYGLSHQAFAEVAQADPHCAMAFWGEAMSRYHQLWEPPEGDELRQGAAEIGQAVAVGGGTPRERQYIAALGQYYADAEHTPPAVRAQRYSDAMAGVARDNPADVEARVFYALSLVATAAPTDPTHARQKQAVAILAPLWKKQPRHPGLAHYLIHANDSAELAPQGLAAARAYAKIAPSAPHALHMPSHIFTRLGLWRDSVASNQAAWAAAKAQGDVGEALHAMDYLTYADLQLGRIADARKVAGQAKAMSGLEAASFKVGYAANAIAVRVAVETRDWPAAASLQPLPGTSARVAAIVYWARALGRVRAEPGASALPRPAARRRRCLLGGPGRRAPAIRGGLVAAPRRRSARRPCGPAGCGRRGGRPGEAAGHPWTDRAGAGATGRNAAPPAPPRRGPGPVQAGPDPVPAPPRRAHGRHRRLRTGRRHARGRALPPHP
jgi:hypothetical protein